MEVLVTGDTDPLKPADEQTLSAKAAGLVDHALGVNDAASGQPRYSGNIKTQSQVLFSTANKTNCLAGAANSTASQRFERPTTGS